MKITKSKILEIRNLNVKYGPNQKSTIKNFELDLKQGDHLAIIGPSGCGKTTFAKTIINMLPCLLYTSPSPRDLSTSRMPSSA